jgi:hypothetical protein
MASKNQASFFLTKLCNFEYWPYGVFYIPMYFYGLYLALKARSFMYFSTTNPCMKYGGVIGDSKYKVLSLIPEQYLPNSIFIPRSTSFSRIEKIIRHGEIDYPLIIKPDIGERGKDVEIMKSAVDLKSYLKNKSDDLIIQEYVSHGLEFGILYHRFPSEKKGRITSIVEKSFLTVTGDGKQSLLELMSTQIRATGRLEYLHEKFKNELAGILPEGKKINLEPIGNHCRGTTFYDAHLLINDQLNEVFDEIALEIHGFHYGRFDIKVPTLEDLYNGENIKIFELNGVSSEVAHIYDPDYKLVQAYKDIAANMKIIARIAKKNHLAGQAYDPLGTFLKDLIFHLKK